MTTGPYVGKGYVGLLSMSTDVGATLWYNIYVVSSSGTVKPIDGGVTIDNSRYMYYIKVDTHAHILVISTADGTIRRQARFGDTSVTPLALTVSKLDRIAWNAVAAKSSVLSNSNPFTSQSTIVGFWDSIIAETVCSGYSLTLPSVDGSGNDVNNFMIVKMSSATYPQVKTRSVPLSTFSLFNIN